MPAGKFEMLVCNSGLSSTLSGLFYGRMTGIEMLSLKSIKLFSISSNASSETVITDLSEIELLLSGW